MLVDKWNRRHPGSVTSRLDQARVLSSEGQGSAARITKEQATMNASFEKAMKLAVLSGLKATLGPAFLMTAQRRPERDVWVTAAMAEMVLDKVGILPRRSWLPAMIPRALSGAWVARESMRGDGIDDPWA